ncbi:hypothetical protein [Mesorhizobium sp. ZC-5]|uniref:hypothetical protein n=1 Tax=Mesorhizobium sp. ZC-5 TaxID=2986066 RepID=UPI0021E7D4CC|nr:hypothetical protein [Mesorhizobium sp. ZC-5]MCV3241813.1 hypothetical protein [Mesorhizobium sp. ZC-5]
MRSTTVCTIFIYFVSSEISFAECSLENFDKTLPRAISSDVDSPDGNFTWSSDFDRKDGLSWVWNYIKNTHASSDLNVSWPKAGLEQSFVKPLPHGETFCAEYPVTGLEDNDIDDDAPITYGARNTKQRAAVYAKKETAELDSRRFISKISSAYRNDDGLVKPIEIEVSYAVKDGIIEEINILSQDNLYVSIGAYQNVWSEATYDSLIGVAKSQDIDFIIEPLAKFAKGDVSKDFYTNLKRSK